MEITKRKKIEFWNNVYGFDMSCIKKVALREPLVDTVDQRAVVTDAFALKTFDLHTIKKEDLAFSSEFRLKALQNDYVHAFIAYFDIAFTACHKQVYFSTAPHAKYTHWKQTVLYIDDVITINQKEAITGTLKCVPNEKNPRDLDITLSYKFSGELSHSTATHTFHMC